MKSADIRILCLEASGLETARGVAGCLGGRLILKDGIDCGEPHDSCADFAGAVRDSFVGGHPVVGICAAGILIRILAPLIRDKQSEPPVLCVSEDGRSVVPLLGGHHGANDLAGQLAGHLSAHAAITTAGDLKLGVALDCPPEGWKLENPADSRTVTAAILAGRPTMISTSGDWLAPMERLANVEIHDAPDPDSPCLIQVEGIGSLVYRQQVLHLGVGASRHCPPDDMIGLVMSVLADNGLPQSAIASVHSVDIKSDEAAIHALAGTLGLEARFFAPQRLEAERHRLRNPSEIVHRETGCHGVSEAAALAAAGPDSCLVVEKHKSATATCAIARQGALAGDSGKKRGRLAIVGLGPGEPASRTREATLLLAEARQLVGYRGYLESIGPLAGGKELHGFPLGEEEERCRFALERAGAGGSVALVCSGDAGIYAMGSLVMELLARGDGAGGVSGAAQRAEIVSAPGITAMQAASAQAGAMLGHDFCAISLSDLLTPRDDIIRRVRAAAEGDLVVGFYNPVSRRRRDLLETARDILLEHRPADTPAIIARNLGRPGSQLRIGRLDQLEAGMADMMTIVLVGNSDSRSFRSGDLSAGDDGWRAYTPRGYGIRMEAGE